MRIIAACSSLIFALPLCAGAACTLHSGAERPQLLELYTSEGCSSCPPAEAWLNALHAGGEVVPLAFHVDYWDGLGWRDRFAQPGFAARQRMIVARTRSGSYTPQVVRDGVVWRDWHRGGAIKAQAAAAFPFGIEFIRDGLEVRWHTGADAAQASDGYRVFVALIEDGLQSRVRAGENAGKTLQHDHVVRAFSGPHRLDAGVARLRPRSEVNLDRATVVAWTEYEGTGAVGHLLQLQVSDCGAAPP